MTDAVKIALINKIPEILLAITSTIAAGMGIYNRYRTGKENETIASSVDGIHSAMQNKINTLDSKLGKANVKIAEHDKPATRKHLKKA